LLIRLPDYFQQLKFLNSLPSVFLLTIQYKFIFTFIFSISAFLFGSSVIVISNYQSATANRRKREYFAIILAHLLYTAIFKRFFQILLIMYSRAFYFDAF
ncbi:MAG: hypothetical protein ACK5RD_21520, partial [Aphanizomenon sp.]